MSESYKDKKHIKGLIFASTFITITHDLEGQKINQSTDAAAITCSIFSTDNYLPAIFSCPRGNSATFYLNFLRQLREVDDDGFITILNNILTCRVEAALMPESFSPSEDDLRKINVAQQLARQSVKPGGSVFDLKKTSQAVRLYSINTTCLNVAKPQRPATCKSRTAA